MVMQKGLNFSEKYLHCEMCSGITLPLTLIPESNMENDRGL